jgi:hypothetical protein
MRPPPTPPGFGHGTNGFTRQAAWHRGLVTVEIQGGSLDAPGLARRSIEFLRGAAAWQLKHDLKEEIQNVRIFDPYTPHIHMTSHTTDDHCDSPLGREPYRAAQWGRRDPFKARKPADAVLRGGGA